MSYVICFYEFSSYLFYFYYLQHHHTEGTLGLFALILNLVVVFLVDGRIKELVQQFTGLVGLRKSISSF